MDKLKQQLADLSMSFEDYIKKGLDFGSSHTHVVESVHRVMDTLKELYAEQSEARDKA